MLPIAAALLPHVLALAPGLVRHLAGDRAGEVAEAAGVAVRAVVGTEDPAEVAAVLAADPAKAGELALELGRVEAAAEGERLRAALADVSGARAQTVELARAGSGLAWGAAACSGVVLALFAFSVIAGAFGVPVAEGSGRLLEWGLVAVLGYWLGSSAGSARKDARLAGAGR